MNTIYTAGPMTWYPQFNYPAFDKSAAELRAMGFEVISPAELDNPEDRAAALASPDGDPSRYSGPMGWPQFLARDVELIGSMAEKGTLDSIVVLEGWERSSGARLETFVGAGLKQLPVYTYHIHEDSPWACFHDVKPIQLYRAWCADDSLVLNIRPFAAHLEAMA